MEAVTTSLIEWGVAEMALPGQEQSGDLYAVEPFPNGMLVAALDGLGHGGEAAASAKAAVACIKKFAHEGVISLVKRCHESLRATRGAAMSLAAFNALDQTMTWIGVGNVQGMLLRSDSRKGMQAEFLLVRGGVVGWQLPALGASIATVDPGDTLIFHTDGILSCVAMERQELTGSPQVIADNILKKYSLCTDDALVLVARYLGEHP